MSWIPLHASARNALHSAAAPLPAAASLPPSRKMYPILYYYRSIDLDHVIKIYTQTSD